MSERWVRATLVEEDDFTGLPRRVWVNMAHVFGIGETADGYSVLKINSSDEQVAQTQIFEEPPEHFLPPGTLPEHDA